MDVVILTESRYENVPADDAYVGNLLFEDNLLRENLERLGLQTVRVDWARTDFDWSRPRVAVFRSTWDYFHRYSEFLAWLDRVESQLLLVNNATLVRWNADKRYLLDLSVRGIETVKTCVISQGNQEPLADWLRRCGWSDAVLKPVVSGAARHTYRVSRDNVDTLEPTFRDCVAAEPMLLQPFERRIMEEGEISLMVIGGRFTHSVRKIAKPGDFRVQDDHGGTVHPHQASSEEIEFAERAVAACSPRPLYARVDLIRDEQYRLRLMELELIEPELFFRFHPPAAEMLAKKIAAML